MNLSTEYLHTPVETAASAWCYVRAPFQRREVIDCAQVLIQASVSTNAYKGPHPLMGTARSVLVSTSGGCEAGSVGRIWPEVLLQICGRIELRIGVRKEAAVALLADQRELGSRGACWIRDKSETRLSS